MAMVEFKFAAKLNLLELFAAKLNLLEFTRNLLEFAATNSICYNVIADAKIAINICHYILDICLHRQNILSHGACTSMKLRLNLIDVGAKPDLYRAVTRTRFTSKHSFNGADGAFVTLRANLCKLSGAAM